MTGDEYRDAISHLKLTQIDSATFFHVNETTVRKWIAEKHSIPAAVEMLLLVMRRYNLTPEHVMSLVHH
jgi:DNA-binding transcriptional regulator YiaG